MIIVLSLAVGAARRKFVADRGMVGHGRMEWFQQRLGRRGSGFLWALYPFFYSRPQNNALAAFDLEFAWWIAKFCQVSHLLIG